MDASMWLQAVTTLLASQAEVHSHFQKCPGRLADSSQYTASANISPFIKQHVSTEDKCNPQEHFVQSTVYRYRGNSQHQQ
jgi:hypothetical protein